MNLRQLLRDEAGQDLVEFALVAALAGLAGYLTLAEVGPALKSAYVARDNGVQELWQPRDPGK